MKHLLQQIFQKFLYLTPIGYILSLLALQTGEKTPGVYVELSRDMPIKAHIKQNPLFTDRLGWFLNGTSLFLQAFFVLNQEIADINIIVVYAWISLVFGVVSLVSAFFPQFEWNKGFTFIRITSLEVIVILLLGMSVIIAEL